MLYFTFKKSLFLNYVCMYSVHVGVVAHGSQKGHQVPIAGGTGCELLNPDGRNRP